MIDVTRKKSLDAFTTGKKSIKDRRVWGIKISVCLLWIKEPRKVRYLLHNERVACPVGNWRDLWTIFSSFKFHQVGIMIWQWGRMHVSMQNNPQWPVFETGRWLPQLWQRKNQCKQSLGAQIPAVFPVGYVYGEDQPGWYKLGFRWVQIARHTCTRHFQGWLWES